MDQLVSGTVKALALRSRAREFDQPSMAGSPKEHNWPRSLWAGRMALLLPPSLSMMLASVGVLTELAVSALLQTLLAVQ